MNPSSYPKPLKIKDKVTSNIGNMWEKVPENAVVGAKQGAEFEAIFLDTKFHFI